MKKILIVSLLVCLAGALLGTVMLPPRDLRTTVSGHNVEIRWEESAFIGGVFSFTGANFDVLGFEFDSLTVANRYSPEMLLDRGVAGGVLTQVGFTPNAPQEFRIRIYKGSQNNPARPMRLIATQHYDARGITEDEFQRPLIVEFDEPIPIPVMTEDLWIVKTVIRRNRGPGENVRIGSTEGLTSAIDTYGNLMMRPDNQTWTTLALLGQGSQFRRIFTIYAYAALPNDETVRFNENEARVLSDTDLDITGYHIYRDDVRVGNLPANARLFTERLLPAGTHRYEIKTVYEGGETSVPRVINVPVGVASIDLMTPHLQEFEETTLPSGWTTYVANATGFDWYTSPVGMNGGRAARSDSRLGGNTRLPDNWLITPRIVVPQFFPGNGVFTLSYFVSALDQETGDEYYEILVSEDGVSLDSFERIFYERLEESQDAWRSRSFILPQFHGKEIHIAIRHYNSSMSSLLIDNFRLASSLPTLPPPTNLRAAVRNTGGAVSVDLSWDEPATGDLALLGYHVFRNNQQITTELVTSTEYNDANVSADRDYNYQVLAVYEGNRNSVRSDRTDITTTVSDSDDTLIPLVTKLGNNFPNPFNPNTTIYFELHETTNVRLEVFNIRGQLVKTLVDGTTEAGRHHINWYGVDNSGNRASSGIYLYKLETDSHSEMRRMIMLK